VIPTPPEYVAASGVLAEASKASAEKGARLVDLIVARLAEAIREAFSL
jgi:creatinine amidohydrolase